MLTKKEMLDKTHKLLKKLNQYEVKKIYDNVLELSQLPDSSKRLGDIIILNLKPIITLYDKQDIQLKQIPSYYKKIAHKYMTKYAIDILSAILAAKVTNKNQLDVNMSLFYRQPNINNDEVYYTIEMIDYNLTKNMNKYSFTLKKVKPDVKEIKRFENDKAEISKVLKKLKNKKNDEKRLLRDLRYKVDRLETSKKLAKDLSMAQLIKINSQIKTPHFQYWRKDLFGLKDAIDVPTWRGGDIVHVDANKVRRLKLGDVAEFGDYTMEVFYRFLSIQSVVLD